MSKRLKPEVHDIHQDLHARLLIVDNDASSCRKLRTVATAMGFITACAASLRDALSIAQHEPSDIVLINATVSCQADPKAIRELSRAYPNCRMIVATKADAARSFVDVVPVGVCDYIVQPFAMKELQVLLASSRQRQKALVTTNKGVETSRSSMEITGLIGTSPAMERLYRLMGRVASSTHPVLIAGEPGSGKSLIAEAIHNAGPNARKAFVSVNCASLEHSLIESIFWQSTKPFLSAFCPFKSCIFAATRGGTLFFDEIDALPSHLQIRLVHALRSMQVNSTGVKRSSHLPVRVLAATKVDLTALVEQHRFRRDLCLHLKVMVLSVPPLRNRKEDLSLLASHFLEELAKVVGGRSLSSDALERLVAYTWPNNLWELRSVIERACQMSSGPVITGNDLPSELPCASSMRYTDELPNHSGGSHLHDRIEIRPGVVPLRELNRQVILETLRQMNGDKLMAAQALGIGKTTLYRRLKEYESSQSHGH